MAKYKIIPSSRTIVHSPISIGHTAEKGVEAIEFDLTAWVETYGSGTLTVIMRRWGDAIPYPIALEIDENNKATWVLSDTDTAKAGMAYAQLSYIVGDEVVKKSDIYTFRVMDSLTGEGEPPEAYESWLEHLTHLAAEAMAEVLDIEGIVTDKTLTVDGGVADAKATGDALSALEDRVDALEAGDSGSGLTDAVKTALLQLAQKVAYIDDDGQDYYDDLYDALYLPADLVSISAVYTQSGTVYETDTLNSLKSDLVVTAIYSDSTTRTLTDYSLSGTLAKGTSTITVTYSDKTTTFNVTVTSDVDDPIVITDRTYTPGYINDSGNITSLANNYVSNMYIPFSGHIIIDFTKNRNDVTSCRIAEYDSNQTFIKRSYITVRKTGGAESFVLDSNTAYVRVGFATTVPESVFANFEVLKNTGISNYLYYEFGTIDDTGNEQTSNSRVRTGFIDLSNGTSAFKILYSALSNAVAVLKLYDSSKVYGEQIPNAFDDSAVNTGTTYSFARLLFTFTSTFNSAAVANSAIVIDGTLYRLKEGGE